MNYTSSNANGVYGGNSQGVNSEVYFAADTAENLASTCIAKSASFYQTLNANYYLDKIVSQWQFYHGEYGGSIDGDSHRVAFTGEMGELTQLPVNHYRNIAQHIINMISGTRPTMECRAINSDYKSLSQTIVANGILDYYMREKGLEKAIKKITEMAVVLGCGYLRMEWNSTAGEAYDVDEESGEKVYQGDAQFDVLSPFDVVFDGTKDGWTNDWILVRSKKNRFDLMAKYPELKEKISNIPPVSQTQAFRYVVFSNDSTDDIYVYEFFHRKTDSLPEGRYTMYLDTDVILMDLPLPYREIPVFRLAAAEFMGTPYAYSPMFDIFPIQEGINSLYSTILTNQQAFGVQNLFVKHGSDVDINSLEGALNIIMGNEAPIPLQMCSTPPEVFKFLDTLIQAAETVSGVSSVTRGNPETSLKSGTALALVQSMSLQFISGLQNNYVKFIEDIGISLINILQDYANTPRTISIVGKSNMYATREFDKDDITAIGRVVVDVGNPLAKTTAGRVQMAEQLLQMGMIQNPKQYLQIINTGDIEDMFEGDFKELMNIKRENEFMMEGKPVFAIYLDNHKEHILEHKTLLSDPELRQNKQLVENVMNHIQQHITELRTVDPDLLMITNQTPLQPPPGQPMPGGPQGGPPAPGPNGPPQGGPPMPQGPVQHVIHHQAPQGAPMPQNGPPNGHHPASASNQQQHGGKPPHLGAHPPMGQVFNQPSGMGQMPKHIQTANMGQTSVPQPAQPPKPFQNLPTNINQVG
jgi:hypothetical protein